MQILLQCPLQIRFISRLRTDHSSRALEFPWVARRRKRGAQVTNLVGHAVVLRLRQIDAAKLKVQVRVVDLLLQEAPVLILHRRVAAVRVGRQVHRLLDRRLLDQNRIVGAREIVAGHRLVVLVNIRRAHLSQFTRGLQIAVLLPGSVLLERVSIFVVNLGQILLMALEISTEKYG